MKDGIQRSPSGGITYRGERFAGFNKPKKAPAGSDKKFVVLGKEGDKIKKVSYGHRDYEDFRQHKDTGRRANFRARHNCETANDKTTARHWACKHLWSTGSSAPKKAVLKRVARK